jgi:hypothetical protein
MHLIEIFLPVTAAAVHFAEVREELTQRFGGITAFTQSPAEGFWKDADEDLSHDKIIVVEVMTPSLDRDWWHIYRRSLEKRFAQDAIVLRVGQCELL